MTPEQALQVLVQLAALGHAPRNDHLMAEQAAQVLKAVLEDLVAARTVTSNGPTAEPVSVTAEQDDGAG